MALDIMLILVFAFSTWGARSIKVHAKPDLPVVRGKKGPQGLSFPIVHSFSEEIQNVSISGL
jgi:hypothetical protein